MYTYNIVKAAGQIVSRILEYFPRVKNPVIYSADFLDINTLKP